jgi:hypothetical protein
MKLRPNQIQNKKSNINLVLLKKNINFDFNKQLKKNKYDRS